MEPAVRDPASSPSWMDAALDLHQSRGSDKVVSLVVPGAASPEAAGPAASRDWSSALDLVREAGEAIRIAEERATDLQSQLHRVTAQATAEVRRLETQLANAAQLALKAEERARVAEQRAAEAEGWLVRLYDAVMTSFGRPK